MSEQRSSDVLGALPRRRPYRRSDKRPPAPAVEASPSAPRGRGAQPEAKAEPAASARSKRTASPTQASGRSTQPKRPRQPKQPAATASPATPRATASPATPRRRTQPLAQPAQPAGVPPTPDHRRPAEPNRRRILGTAAQAAAELAEIGISVSARALRNAVDRLPRP